MHCQIFVIKEGFILSVVWLLCVCMPIMTQIHRPAALRQQAEVRDGNCLDVTPPETRLCRCSSCLIFVVLMVGEKNHAWLLFLYVGAVQVVPNILLDS